MTLAVHGARRRACRGFTLVEMLVVLMIIAVLMAATLGGLKTARRMAWRTKARDMARQVVSAWNVYLIDLREFPPEDQFKDVVPGGFAATAANLKALYTGANVYLEMSEEELKEVEGLKAETLKRLEDEHAAFLDFLAKLREAKDKAEFDQFMKDRSAA